MPRPDGGASLFRFARYEADRHKWIESEKYGRDLGDEAIRDWERRFWRLWLRDRWLEHLNGNRLWHELPARDFGLLCREFHRNHALVERIVERIKQGGENLDILDWAIDEHLDVDDTIAILKVLDINSARLCFRLG